MCSGPWGSLGVLCSPALARGKGDRRVARMAVLVPAPASWELGSAINLRRGAACAHFPARSADSRGSGAFFSCVPEKQAGLGGAPLNMARTPQLRDVSPHASYRECYLGRSLQLFRTGPSALLKAAHILAEKARQLWKQCRPLRFLFGKCLQFMVGITHGSCILSVGLRPPFGLITPNGVSALVGASSGGKGRKGYCKSLRQYLFIPVRGEHCSETSELGS